MAYYLAAGNDATREYVSIPALTLAGDFIIEMEFSFDGTQNWRPMGRIDSFSSRFFKAADSNEFRISGDISQTITMSGVVYEQRNIYRLVRSGQEISLSINGALQGSVNDAAQFEFNSLFTQNSEFQSRGPSELYRVRVWGDTTETNLLRDYDPSASNGTGLILPDTAGSNDGTLVNFPNDDTHWVFYDDGQGGIVTADAAYTIAAPTFTANASATLPQPIADATFTINAPTFAATASATIPGFNASVSFAIPAPTFSADAAVTLPSPTADVSYTIAAPTFSVDADATLPQPSSDVAFTVNSPSFAVTATATEPGFNASVSFTVNAPTFAVDATATLPQPSADVGFTVSAPTFSVVAIVGGIAIIVDNETNINVPALATNINAPVLSNNMRI